MKAIVQDTYGSTEVLEFRDIDRPTPTDNQVLVRVHAAGLDRGVWHVMAGMPYLVRLLVPTMGLRKPKVPVRGMDLAGTVEAVGDKVTRFQPGDAVFGWTDTGSYAEYACAPEDHLAPKPANVSFEQAAAVPISGFAALQAVRDEGEIQPGQQVLVIGAAGGVGSFAVQLAKAFGAHVTGVGSTTQVDLVRSLGADDVVDYTREDVTDGRRHWDLILDTAGHRSLSRLRRALTPRGTLVMVGGESGDRWVGGALWRNLRALLWSPFISQRPRPMVAWAKTPELQVLKDLVEAGSITPVIDSRYSLSDTPDAIRRVQEGHAVGKVVITVG